MKIALLAVLGLVLGALGGGALGIGLGIAWSEALQASAQDKTGTLIFFTFLPLGAFVGAFGGAVLFGVLAVRDGDIQIERDPPADGRKASTSEA